MNNILEHRTWRYATKKFDASKKISHQDLETLLEATRLSASSYGLQPYHVFVITDPEIREKLKPVSWNQTQIKDASHLIVFAHATDFGEELVDDFITNLSDTRDIPLDGLNGYAEMMKSNLLGLPTDVKASWAGKQVYIALGNALQAAAELQIDTCPMEGFQPEEYNRILGLTDKNLNAAVVLAVGYRSQEDETQHLPKVRKSKEELFTHI
ncbi:NAD(P)H-dependent oxidoreductase [Flagellimonas alvinocaridis]|uniref:NAD(P)H-dependent oxidoreductase n=1 Tax=Flagellimonas alvinocaridis TaxID=2530200 RepID=A0A4S8RKT1_9FLAO|nr:NAD(P)H-dependent oxidoreductase [Allomuricauda alvinocaridis]THV59097.1 NAD(P)H-dependent oxidoreductase [Allomuricauda alvinocaridis]